MKTLNIIILYTFSLVTCSVILAMDLLTNELSYSTDDSSSSQDLDPNKFYKRGSKLLERHSVVERRVGLQDLLVAEDLGHTEAQKLLNSYRASFAFNNPKKADSNDPGVLLRELRPTQKDRFQKAKNNLNTAPCEAIEQLLELEKQEFREAKLFLRKMRSSGKYKTAFKKSLEENNVAHAESYLCYHDRLHEIPNKVILNDDDKIKSEKVATRTTTTKNNTTKFNKEKKAETSASLTKLDHAKTPEIVIQETQTLASTHRISDELTIKKEKKLQSQEANVEILDINYDRVFCPSEYKDQNKKRKKKGRIKFPKLIKWNDKRKKGVNNEISEKIVTNSFENNSELFVEETHISYTISESEFSESEASEHEALQDFAFKEAVEKDYPELCRALRKMKKKGVENLRQIKLKPSVILGTLQLMLYEEYSKNCCMIEATNKKEKISCNKKNDETIKFTAHITHSKWHTDPNIIVDFIKFVAGCDPFFESYCKYLFGECFSREFVRIEKNNTNSEACQKTS